MRATTGYVGLGKATHLIVDDTAVCGVKGGAITPSWSERFRVTCKRCLRHLAAEVTLAEGSAYIENARREMEAERETAAAAHVHGLTMSATQRRAARRAQARKLRATSAQTRAVARAARVKRNGTPAPARTLLVAAGLPDELAKRYASAFSKGVATWNPETSKRVRTGAHRSKRVAVKVFTPAEFADRLATYAPKNPEHAAAFALAG
jgi:hypothetical protein